MRGPQAPQKVWASEQQKESKSGLRSFVSAVLAFPPLSPSGHSNRGLATYSCISVIFHSDSDLQGWGWASTESVSVQVMATLSVCGQFMLRQSHTWNHALTTVFLVGCCSYVAFKQGIWYLSPCELSIDQPRGWALNAGLLKERECLTLTAVYLIKKLKQLDPMGKKSRDKGEETNCWKALLFLSGK